MCEITKVIAFISWLLFFNLLSCFLICITSLNCLFRAPYDDPLTVFIFNGSTPYGGCSIRSDEGGVRDFGRVFQRIGESNLQLMGHAARANGVIETSRWSFGALELS
jgi:hypothetical protein